VARAIPCLTTEDHPEDLWRPLLARGAPAHQWIERFYWEWFTNGFDASPSTADFVQIWQEMIIYALNHSAWNPERTASYELDGAVFELLCLNMNWNAIVQSDQNAGVIGNLQTIFERAIQHWGAMPKIIKGLVNFVAQPGASLLLLPSLRWISSAVKKFDTYSWKYGLEENVIEFLHTCWQRESVRIVNTPTLKEPFLGLLTIVASRGSHAAIALNTRVSGSLSG